MATTQKGIYYPDDYTAVADVPEDMKKQAESVDAVIGESESTTQQTISTLQGQVSDIQDEQTTQNNEITALQTENTRLKATLPTTTDEGENITLSKTAELEFIQPPLPRGNSEQVQLSGKNKFNPVLLSQVKDYNTYNSTTKLWTTTSTSNYTRSILYNVAGNNTNRDINKLIKLKANTTYTIKMFNFVNNTERTTSYINYGFYDNTGTFINSVGGTEIATFTTESECWLDIRRTESSGSFTFSNIQLEEGSTATSYEPYCGGTASPNPSYPQSISNVTGDVEVLVQNKNYFDLNKILYGEIDSNGDLSLYAATRDFYKIDFKENTQYTISGYVKRTSGNVRLRCMYTDGTYSEFFNPAASDNFSFSSFTSLANKTIDKIVVYYGSAGYLYIKDGEMQIEQGSTATTHTPHKEQTFTFPLGTQRLMLGDYLADDGIHHVRKQVVLDGSSDEGWIMFSNAQGFKLIIANIGGNATDTIISNVLCNQLRAVKQIDIYLGNIDNGVSSLAGTVRAIYVRFDETITSEALLRQKLAENPITVEYELAEEEITPYTTEQQQAYDEIKQAISYEEQTNISGSSDEANPLFSVETYQSTKLILENIDSRLTIVES